MYGLVGRDEVGGPDGVRTRDRRIKSPSLYLTKLQAQPSDRTLLLERCASISSVFNHLSVEESQRLFGSQEPLCHTYQ